MPFVDTHAHAFLTSLPMDPARRYTPARDCPAETYLSVLAAADIGMGVLVQPSFLGFDNSYLIQSLERYPDRLRGIAVVDGSVSDDELERMQQAGVVGIRFNMVGRDIGALSSARTKSLLRRVDSLDWQVEVQCRGAEIPAVLRALDSFRGPLIFDHFGLPDPSRGVTDSGFRALLSEGPTGRTFVKLSAGYRSQGIDVASCAGALLAVLGARRLLWGSDWPFTQFERVTHFSGVLNEFRRWIPDLSAREAIDATAMGLFKFSNELNALSSHRRRMSAIGL